jgi:hypothetical protein
MSKNETALRDDERMPGGDGEIVPDDYGELVRENDALRVERAEGAGAGHAGIL